MARRRRKRPPNFPRESRSSSARGYGTAHQAERRRWGLVVEAGQALCCRCGGWIAPGSPFHLDHRDDKLGYLGVSHAACNLRAAARKGNAVMRENRQVVPEKPRAPSFAFIPLGRQSRVW
jgi:hypothetical protein